MGGRGVRRGVTLMSASTDMLGSDIGSAEEIKHITRDDIARLQRAMGQTGYEAGDPDARPRDKLYVKSSKAFNINAYLLSDGETIHSPYSDWDSLGYTESDIRRAISQIDSGMKPMSESIVTYRYLDGDALGKMVGDERIAATGIKRFLTKLSKSKDARDSLGEALKNTDYVHKGYTSTTYVDSHGSYDSRPIKLEMVIDRGSPAIITNNHAEHEILVGRNAKYRFTGEVRVDEDLSGRKQLVIRVHV